MYFYNLPTSSCATTSSSYTDVATCQANLAAYLPGKTTGVCYTTLSACEAVSPAPMYFYNLPTSSCATTSSSYTDVATCQANLAAYLPGKTTGVCYTTLSACEAVSPAPMYFYNLPTSSCATTSSSYTDVATCQANLAAYLPGKTTGVCYTTLSACEAVSPAPMYFYNLPTSSCATTSSSYTDVATCQANLAAYLPGKQLVSATQH